MTYQRSLGTPASGIYEPVVQNALSAWNRRRKANWERDNATGWDYYVDSVGGLDTNDGLTAQTPWQTMTKVNTSATLTAGKRVGIKRGSVFRGVAFTVPGTGGSAASPVVFGSYGQGKLPVWKGSTVLSGFTLSSGSKYTLANTANPALLFVDEDTLLTKAASAAAVTAGTFFSDGTTVTLWLADSSNPSAHVIETPSFGSTLITCAQPHVIFQDLAWKHSTANAAVFFNATAASSVNMQVRRCDIGPTVGTGLLMGCARGLVEDCYFHDNWNGLEYPASAGGSPAFTTNTDGTEVRYNLVLRSFKGIYGTNTHANLNIHHNIVLMAHVNGIDITGGTASKPTRIWNNFVWHHTGNGTGHGIDIQTGTAGTGVIMKNNIVYSDEPTGGGNCELYCIDSSTSYTGGTDVDYNLGYLSPAAVASGVAWGKLGTIVYSTLAGYRAALAATSYAGQEAHSISADPLLSKVQWPGGEFVPLSGSPAVNAGTAMLMGPDSLGLPDYIGTAPDLGPYERSALT